MNTERILDCGERGLHLLFEAEMIHDAFSQDARAVRAVVDDRLDEIHAAVKRLLALPSATQAREFVAGLPADVRHVLVLLYFELLDDRLRRRELRH